MQTPDQDIGGGGIAQIIRSADDGAQWAHDRLATAARGSRRIMRGSVPIPDPAPAARPTVFLLSAITVQGVDHAVHDTHVLQRPLGLLLQIVELAEQRAQAELGA